MFGLFRSEYITRDQVPEETGMMCCRIYLGPRALTGGLISVGGLVDDGVYLVRILSPLDHRARMAEQLGRDNPSVADPSDVWRRETDF